MEILKRPGSRLARLSLPLLLSSPWLLGETHDFSLPIIDVSDQGSPIAVSGQVSFHEELAVDSVKTQWTIEAHLINTTNKTILAYEVSIDAISDHGGGVHHAEQADHFFRSELEFAPGAQEIVDVATPNQQLTPRKEGDTPKAPKASFKVIFVQFADGSKFGTSNWGSGLSRSREQTLERLRAVSEQSRTSGEGGLRLALAGALAREDNPKFTTIVLEHLRQTLDAKGPDSAAAEITEFLTAAEKRLPVM